jgi:hypothetical protein
LKVLPSYQGATSSFGARGLPARAAVGRALVFVFRPVFDFDCLDFDGFDDFATVRPMQNYLPV